MLCPNCGNFIEDCTCDWMDNEVYDEPLSEDIYETNYDGDC